jgi:hypothetical protein
MRTATGTLRVALCAAIIAGAATAAAVAADRPDFQPGKWELTINMKMEGMPFDMPSKPVTTTHCVKPEDIKDTQTIAESNLEKKRKCKIADLKQDGDKVTYSFTCEGGANGTSEIVYQGTSYEGTTVMNMGSGPKGPMKMTQTFKGKRVGDC